MSLSVIENLFFREQHMEKDKSKLRRQQARLETDLRNQVLIDPSQENFGAAYDQLHKFFLDKAHKEELYSSDLRWFSKIFLDKIGSGKRVLDIGSGNGKLATALAQNKNEMAGIDISNVALQIAQNRLSKLPNKNSLSISFEQGDARKLKFQNTYFDFVVSHDLIEHISEEDFLVHLTEVKRVLKPGGRYLFWTPSRLRGGSSLGLHLKEYTLRELDAIFSEMNFEYSWIDLRLYKLRITLELPQNRLSAIIMYEKVLESIISFFPTPIKKLLVPPLFLCLTKTQ